MPSNKQIEGRNTLQQELDKLEFEKLDRISRLWNISHANKDKRSLIKKLVQGMQDNFYIKGVLEKLSSAQITIYASLLNSKANVLTLGEIARKMSLPPTNAEMELTVLKRYFLVYQRKNRERLTNNLDRYHYYSESGDLIQLNIVDSSKKFNLSFAQVLQGRPISSEWRQILKSKLRSPNGSSLFFTTSNIAYASQSENIKKALLKLNHIEIEIVRECFQQGGILEMRRVREISYSYKKSWEAIVRKLDATGFLIDEYYIDSKFIRALVLPQEIFDFLQKNPLSTKKKRGVRTRSSQKTCNDLDFCLNMKKLISYLSRRGITLAKSGKIKQIDLRETEEVLLHTDTALFREKSQIYQIDLLLPIARLIDIVRVKNEDIVLRNAYEKILKTDYLTLLKQLLKKLLEKQNRNRHYEEVFQALDVPFPRKDLWDECIHYLQTHKQVMHTVLIAVIVRRRLVLSDHFRIRQFQQKLAELHRELSNVLFYLQLLGLIEVEYPNRQIKFSQLGNYCLFNTEPTNKNEVGGVILNPDMSLVAIPEKLSIKSLLLLKAFCELKSFDNVYTFQITKQSFQNGILLKEDPKEFVHLLEATSRQKLSQNLLFSIDDWSKSFPLVKITDECVVVQTKDPKHMSLLLGQITVKRIVQDKINRNTILIHPNRISDVIHYAEKLDLLIQLVR